MSPLPEPQFRALTITHKSRALRIITEVEISEAFDLINPPTPLPKILSTKALWDTGATGSVITKETVKSLGLIPTGTAVVHHLRGSTNCNTYLINFGLPNKVRVMGVQAIEGEDVVGHFGAIIGMDIITEGDFAITNTGRQTCMSFRIPSIQKIDYVEEWKKQQFNGLSRNDPCPCGSGKKFKKCHGRII